MRRRICIRARGPWLALLGALAALGSASCRQGTPDPNTQAEPHLPAVAPDATPSPQPNSMPANDDTTADAPSPGSIAAELDFLRQHGEVITLEAPSGGLVALSAKYQGRVMTSAVDADGKSLGYVNRDFIAKAQTGTQFDNYGGEDRFWLGPEGGQFALYFPKGKPFEFEHWQTPAAFQEGAWTVAEQSQSHVTFTRAMKVANYSGSIFEMDVRRTVRLLDVARVQSLLGELTQSLDGVRWVGFETENQITNTGKLPWTKQSGAPSIWILAMYNPSPDTWGIVPFEKDAEGPIVNDAYFGKVPPERLIISEHGVLLFKCDGNYRSKIGVAPARAKPFAGSYSRESQLLTLVHYDRPPDATHYVNSMWELQKNPFGGDVVNSYNDGPVEPGKPALGGFYELETSSPAAFLKPGETATHTHRTLHLVGEQAVLEPLAQGALGVSLSSVLEATAAKN